MESSSTEIVSIASLSSARHALARIQGPSTLPCAERHLRRESERFGQQNGPAVMLGR